MQNRKFTDEEWKICLKVLDALKDNPLDNPDNLKFKTLITKIHKNAKKFITEVDSTENLSKIKYKKDLDRDILLQTDVSRQALNNSTVYTGKKQETTPEYKTLHKPKACYSCNMLYNKVHFFYNRLCPECAEYNYLKRFSNINLSGRNVILTGGRVKVGYATALKLLRSNANLILTTRFPALALDQLRKEPDYNHFKDRLIVFGLDLRNLHAVDNFISYVKTQFTTLDILINNAAQTIKYPDNYYQPLINNEQAKLKSINANTSFIPNNTPVSGNLKFLETNSEIVEFTENRFGQPIDNRARNSWNSKLEDIDTYELLEVNLINQISPYILIRGLKPLFLKSSFEDKFIINVTSSEGQFSYTNKTIYHPHTNMTKAALNMMTHTSAKEFAKDKIYMNSVDVGWISTGAIEPLRQKQFESGYIPPLDPVDGAARIIQPIEEIFSGNKLYGKLLKNYKEAEW